MRPDVLVVSMMVPVRHVHTLVALAAVVGCKNGADATPLVAPGSVTLMTLNIASGAGDHFRTAENRTKQSAFVARSGAQLVGLQEVDVGVDRSGKIDTAASVAASLGFGTCTFAVDASPHMSPDGTRLTRCTGGSIVFGMGFRADDPFAADAAGNPSGIMDSDPSLNPTGVDRSPDAFYGNALIVSAPWEVEATYTVALPIDALGPSAPAALLERLAQEGPPDDAIAALAEHNVATRRQRGVEPRSALVVRVRKPGTTAISVITTHLESSGSSDLRRAQLDAVVAIARGEQRKSNHDVAVMGDFNMSVTDAEPTLAAADFVRATPPEANADIDQMWIDPSLVADATRRVPTEGVTDHAFAALATVRADGSSNR